MGIQIYNTLTNRKEPLETVQPGKVGIYLCGPTVYKPSHIGHAVGPVIFDAVKRYLVHRGYEVTWVVNITDVDDKLILEAPAKGLTVSALAKQVTRNYMDALAALNVTGIDRFPKASEHIGDIIDFTQRLIDKGAAYVLNGDVYFDITADDDYGKLSNRSVEEQSGRRELQCQVKRHAGDFALWKASKADEPEEVKFDSPWGKGRPGWHIECSVMAMKILGDTFDIHGGGLDLIFPHHENEIAQAETCTKKPFAKYWMHNGLTRFNTKKVSKSDPEMQAALEQMTLSTLLEHYSGELLRYFILSTHYRRPIEYSPEEIESKRKGLTTFYRLFERLASISGRSVYDTPSAAVAKEPQIAPDDAPEHVAALAAEVADARQRFHDVMDDDFNTAAAIAALFELANHINRFIEQQKLETEPNDRDYRVAAASTQALLSLGRLLGLFLEPPAKAAAGCELLEKIMRVHLEVRAACRKSKDFELADMIREGLTHAGITLEDKPTAAAWNVSAPADEALLDKLLQLHLDVRQAARKARNFPMADLVRSKLNEAGVTLEDKPTGTVWHLSG